MDEVATKIIEILRKNMKDPSKAVTLETPLTELESNRSTLPSSCSILRILSGLKSHIMPTKKWKRSRRLGPSWIG